MRHRRLIWQLFLSYAVIVVVTVAAVFLYLHSLPNRNIVNLLVGGFWIVGLAVGVTLFVAYRITAPLEALQREAERFAGGDFSRQMPLLNSVESYEIARLASAMNQMATQLDEKFRTMNHTQQEQQAILSHMTDGIILISAEGKILNLNPAADRFLGESSFQRQGLSIFEAIRNTEIQDLVKTLLQGSEDRLDSVIQYNEQTTLQVQGIKLVNQDSSRVEGLIVLHDISKLKQLETIRKSFIANVSHELKTPITLIQGFIETLQEPDLSQEDRQKFLEIVKSHSDRLHTILEELLSLARIEQDNEGGIVHLEKTDLNEAVQKACGWCKEKLPQTFILNLKCADFPIWVQLNAPLFEQAVVNLIQNARIHSETTKLVVEVSADSATGYVRIIDFGKGIAAEHLPRLFERFYRVDSARQRKEGSTGLGLSIVKHIMIAHNGKVEVESEVGKGTTFTLVLPLESRA